ncbi:MAG: nucleoside transporter C-terminal domain-containing protein [Balneolaceae bacterium]|nr:nucleoside transporter C-terminal domain-containing protein [Balneolaceae bacterium]
MDILRGLLGIFAILAIAWLFSTKKRNISWRLVGSALLLQFALATVLLKHEFLSSMWAPLGWPKEIFGFISGFFVIVLEFTTEGALFLFGDLAKSPGVEGSLGSFFAFQVLPTIVFFASLTAILYHYNVLQWIVKRISKLVQKALRTSGAESLSVITNIFVGQTEAPLVVKPFLPSMTRSELLAIMTGGMATIAGGVMAAYVQMLGNSYAVTMDVSLQAGRLMFAEQLLSASLMAAPAALLIAKIMIPETEEPVTYGDVSIDIPKSEANGIDAAASGAGTGLKLAANVGAMLLAFIALLAMFNYGLEWFSTVTTLNQFLPDGQPLTIQMILGWIFFPIAWLIGVPLQDCLQFGSLIGTKLVLNEFVAYLDLSNLISANSLSPKTITMATFALCGFANFSSIAIQIGGIGSLAPNKKSEIASLGLRAVFAGSLATLLTASIAGLFVGS